MKVVHITVLFSLFAASVSQRSPYAGLRPIGFPELETPAAETQNALGNRFGNGTDSNVTTTTQRLPIEALGDRELVNKLGKLPIDKQPFWFINWQALEENRKNPQTYYQKPNVFNEIHAEKFFNTPTPDNRFNRPQNNIPSNNIPQNNVQQNIPTWNQQSSGSNRPQTNSPQNNFPQNNFPQNNVPQWNLQSTGFNAPQNNNPPRNSQTASKGTIPQNTFSDWNQPTPFGLNVQQNNPQNNDQDWDLDSRYYWNTR